MAKRKSSPGARGSGAGTRRRSPPRPGSPAIVAPAGAEPSQEEKVAIVGIGASAGGLAALRQFFSRVADDSGLAYVVVVHLSPEHESHLATLLQPHSKMRVVQVHEAMPLEPDCVYVIPPMPTSTPSTPTFACPRSSGGVWNARRSTISFARWRKRTTATPSA